MERYYLLTLTNPEAQSDLEKLYKLTVYEDEQRLVRTIEGELYNTGRSTMIAFKGEELLIRHKVYIEK